MTVVFIKVECPKHPGHYSIEGPCDLCLEELCRRDVRDIVDRLAQQLADAVGGAGSPSGRGGT